MIRILQINLRGSQRAQDLVFQTAAQMAIDILVLSEYYRNGRNRFHCDTNNKAAVVVLTPIGITEEGAAEAGFRWIEIGNTRVYACYWSPNTTYAEYEDFISRLENSARTATGEVLIAGDFNAKHQDWGSAQNDAKGDALSEMIHAIGYVACNVGKKPTFQRGASESIIDITFATPNLATRLQQWEVLDEGTESDHNYIYYVLDEPSIVPQQKPQGWVVSKMDTSELEKAMEKITTTNTVGVDVDTCASKLTEDLTDICNKVIPKKGSSNKRKSVHWWNPEIGKLRKTSNHLRRVYQRKLRRTGPDECQIEKEESKTAKRNLNKAIKHAKEQSWKELCEQIEVDPWGLPYRIVMGKLIKNCPITGINKAGRVEQIIKTLFPTHPPRPPATRNMEEVAPQVTDEELHSATMRMKNKKAPGPDGIPAEVLKIVARKNPRVLTEVLNNCINQRKFPTPWKKARLVLTRKGNKPLEDPSSYRPLCMINTLGKLLEKILDNRIRKHLEDHDALDTNQYGFRKHRSTMDAVNHVLNIAKTDGNKTITGILTIDVKNAFNSANWGKILSAATDKRVPPYLCEILEDYLNNRRLVYNLEGRDVDTMLTSGVPQGSILGPTLWNILYDGLLQLTMPQGVEIIAFADDVALVAKSIVTFKVEELLEEAAEITLKWLENTGLEVAVTKSETMLFTKKRTYNTMTVNMRGTDIPSTRSIKYLGVQLDSKLNFKEHSRIASAKASKTAQNLARIMPNVGASKATKRRLLASVVTSQMLYGAQVWADMMQPGGWTILTKCQRKILLRVAMAYRTVSTNALHVITGIAPIKITAEERKTVYEAKKHNRDLTAASEAAKRKGLEAWQKCWDESKTGEWTKKLIKNVALWVNRPYGQTNYHLTQALSGHGCYQAYLHKYKRAEKPNCIYCNHPIDDAEHTLFKCDAWEAQRRRLRTITNTDIGPNNIIQIMLTNKDNWDAVNEYVNTVMGKKEEDERQIQRQMIPN